jgi:energy-coupling factor transport system ATP-binding protein
VIEIENLSYSYPASGDLALSKVDLEIQDGEYVLLAGRSGSGKTSLLRCLNGLIPHFYGGSFRGRVAVGGWDTREHSVRELSELTGMVFQDPENQFVTTSVEREISFGQENLGRESEEVLRRTRELAVRFSLENLLPRIPQEISGGEKQRTIIASVLGMGSGIMALDEPTSQLDLGSAGRILRLLEEFNREGMTVVLGEHRLNRVVPFASRGIMLDRGRVIFDGKPRDLIRSFPWLVRIREPVGGAVSGPIGGTALKVRDLSFKYAGGDWVLRHLHVELKKSEVLGIFGTNGSGKSTLARAIAGLLDGVLGSVSIGGREVGKMTESEKGGKVGIVFQDPNKHLFHDTVHEEVEFARRQMGLAMDGNVDSLLARLHLTEYGSRNPRDLSGGQKQKVAIASVLSFNPEILILDEPTRGLDLPEKVEIMAMLRRLVCEGCISIMILTHDLDIIRTFGDRAAVLKDGAIEFQGDPEQAARIMLGGD